MQGKATEAIKKFEGTDKVWFDRLQYEVHRDGSVYEVEVAAFVGSKCHRQFYSLRWNDQRKEFEGVRRLPTEIEEF